MEPATSVVLCALVMLGRSLQQFPPIKLLDVKPAGLSAGTEGFVQRNPDRIYLITSTPVFRAAMAAQRGGPCAGRESLQKIASIIVHEEWHLKAGGTEQSAYEAQLSALAVMGAGPGTPVYSGVLRSMRTVLNKEREGEAAHQPRQLPPQLAILGSER
jgi:hypothetical protein